MCLFTFVLNGHMLTGSLYRLCIFYPLTQIDRPLLFLIIGTELIILHMQNIAIKSHCDGISTFFQNLVATDIFSINIVQI